MRMRCCGPKYADVRTDRVDADPTSLASGPGIHWHRRRVFANEISGPSHSGVPANHRCWRNLRVADAADDPRHAKAFPRPGLASHDPPRLHTPCSQVIVLIVTTFSVDPVKNFRLGLQVNFARVGGGKPSRSGFGTRLRRAKRQRRSFRAMR